MGNDAVTGVHVPTVSLSLPVMMLNLLQEVSYKI